MDYELAQKLYITGLQWKNRDNFEVYEEDQLPLAYYPTLSELIEACGDGFYNLTNGGDEWLCNYATDGWWETEDCPKGKTPEEAVSLLWLELNKKD